MGIFEIRQVFEIHYNKIMLELCELHVIFLKKFSADGNTGNAERTKADPKKQPKQKTLTNKINA